MKDMIELFATSGGKVIKYFIVWFLYPVGQPYGYFSLCDIQFKPFRKMYKYHCSHHFSWIYKNWFIHNTRVGIYLLEKILLVQNYFRNVIFSKIYYGFRYTEKTK